LFLFRRMTLNKRFSFALAFRLLNLHQNEPTMSIRFLSVILATALLFFLDSCTIITGEGPVVEKGFANEPFQSVNLDGSLNVHIKQGTQQNVMVSGNENIIEKLKMDVLDGTLYLSLEPGNYLNYELDVHLTMTTLKNVTLSGSGDITLGTFVGLSDLNVELDGSGDIQSEGVLEVMSETKIELDGSGDIELKMKAKDVLVILDGSGDVELDGAASKLVVELDGSGDVKAFGLQSLHCEANLDGAGTIKLYASQTLKASLDGSGDILYRGEPRVDASMDGSGSIQAD
jgi:hypothetical protein